jgi:hypothetical protein
MVQDRIERQQEVQSQERIEDMRGTTVDSGRADAANPPMVRVLSLPARSEADEIAAIMLARVLVANHRVVEAASITSLASDMVQYVESHKADVICVSATAPGAMMHARYLCKKLRSRFPNVKLVVGLWDMQGDLTKARERIGCGAIVVATLSDAQEKVRLLQQQLLSQSAQPQLVHCCQSAIESTHPSNYPTQVDIRSNLRRVPGTVDSANLISN